MKKLSCASLLLVILADSVATAHPGHGVDGGDHGLTHYLTEPLHLFAGCGVLTLLLVVLLSRKIFARLKKPLWEYQSIK